jgi:hypothetical protein
MVDCCTQNTTTLVRYPILNKLFGKTVRRLVGGQSSDLYVVKKYAMSRSGRAVTSLAKPPTAPLYIEVICGIRTNRLLS